jgi:hypothetical protein
MSYLCLTVFYMTAQTNLVPNGNFEDLYRPDTCITNWAFFNFGGAGYIRQVKNWFPPNPECSCSINVWL